MEGDAFAYATDERTMEVRKLKHQKRADASPSLKAKMKAFVANFYRSQGEKMHVVRREVEEAPVLKPRRGFRYPFSA